MLVHTSTARLKVRCVESERTVTSITCCIVRSAKDMIRKQQRQKANGAKPVPKDSSSLVS